MKYLKIFTDFLEVMEALDDAERGRLFTAMLCYARQGQEPLLTGSERIVWPAARQQLDRAAEQYRRTCAANALNARQGRRGTVSESAEPLTTTLGCGEPAAAAPGGAQAAAEPSGGAEAAAAVSGGAESPVVVLLSAAGREVPVTAEKAAQLARQYPNTDVPYALGQMRRWLLAHPDRLRREKDLYPFVHRWLGRTAAKPSGQTGAASFDLEEIRRMMLSNSGG